MAIVRTVFNSWIDDDGSETTGTIWNKDAIDTGILDPVDTELDEIQAGGIGIASQAALDFIYAASGTQLARLAKGTALQVPRMNADATAYEFHTPATSPVTLLVADSGTSTNASAENVDTVAISGLTALDSLMVHYVLESDVEATAAVTLYNVTDSVTIAHLSGNAALSNNYGGGRCRLMQMQSAATAWHSEGSGFRGDAAANWGYSLKSTNTTAWTGSWTLALRHGGVTATGTFRWRWAVHKIAGQ